MSCAGTKTYLHDVLYQLDGDTVASSISVLGEGIGSAGAKKLASAFGNVSSSAAVQLERLYLMNNDIGDDGLVSLLNVLKPFSSLHTLNLNGNKITRVGAEALAVFIRESPSLRNVYLLNNPIGADGRDFLFSVLQFRAEIQAFY
jgi:Ran GTPase-activating protein (RanGAP) involved in mRNA processing and transport